MAGGCPTTLGGVRAGASELPASWEDPETDVRDSFFEVAPAGRLAIPFSEIPLSRKPPLWKSDCHGLVCVKRTKRPDCERLDK